MRSKKRRRKTSVYMRLASVTKLWLRSLSFATDHPTRQASFAMIFVQFSWCAQQEIQRFSSVKVTYVALTKINTINFIDHGAVHTKLVIVITPLVAPTNISTNLDCTVGENRSCWIRGVFHNFREMDAIYFHNFMESVYCTLQPIELIVKSRSRSQVILCSNSTTSTTGIVTASSPTAEIGPLGYFN
jgi:hypothetical protein